MIKRKRAKLKEIQSSSMADIAFLLLVFFLVTTTISMEKGIGLILPAIGEELEVNPKNISNVEQVIYLEVNIKHCALLFAFFISTKSQWKIPVDLRIGSICPR